MRLVLLSTAALAIGLAIGVVALTAVLRFGLERATDDAADRTADEVASLLDEGRLPDPIPVGGTTLVQVWTSRAGCSRHRPVPTGWWRRCPRTR